ncbi:hypothetical protein H4R35_004676, partial [Dimargaris xerosporica]
MDEPMDCEDRSNKADVMSLHQHPPGQQTNASTVGPPLPASHMETDIGDDGSESDREMTHAEIWDDSDLIAAWESSLEEYRQFHNQDFSLTSLKTSASKPQGDATSSQPSPATNSGNIGKSAKAAFVQARTKATASKPPRSTCHPTQSDIHATTAHHGTYSAQPGYDHPYPHAEGSGLHHPPPADATAGLGPHQVPTQSAFPTSAGLPLPPADDPELANLLMAWYYAGYYTGLYQ